MLRLRDSSSPATVTIARSVSPLARLQQPSHGDDSAQRVAALLGHGELYLAVADDQAAARLHGGDEVGVR